MNFREEEISIPSWFFDLQNATIFFFFYKIKIGQTRWKESRNDRIRVDAWTRVSSREITQLVRKEKDVSLGKNVTICDRDTYHRARKHVTNHIHCLYPNSFLIISFDPFATNLFPIAEMCCVESAELLLKIVTYLNYTRQHILYRHIFLVSYN